MIIAQIPDILSLVWLVKQFIKSTLSPRLSTHFYYPLSQRLLAFYYEIIFMSDLFVDREVDLLIDASTI